MTINVTEPEVAQTERRLATIRRIKEIRPIEGADNIVCAVVDGWELVTQKSNGFKSGDLVVYFEIDSVLPEREEFEFLRDRCWVSAERSVNGAGFRLKTIKLRGQVSQGLILPIYDLFADAFPEFTKETFDTENWVHFLLTQDGLWLRIAEGLDVTDVLGVVKFEKPLPANLAGVARGNFPTFIPKTDQERIQNCFKTFQIKWSDHYWEETMKLDGSSFTAYFKKEGGLEINGEWKGQFGVCSRNLDLQETEGNSFWQAARKYNIESNLRSMGRSLAIQGELMGPGIQGNRENLTELKLFVFDIYDIDQRSYLGTDDRHEICRMLELDHVPILHVSRSLQDWSLQDLLDEAGGSSINHKIREGVVFKSRTDPNISFKVINNKFLLTGGDD